MIDERGFTDAAHTISKALGKRARDHEIYLVGYTSLTVEVRDSEVDFLEVAEERGAALRVIKDGRLGFSFSSTLDAADLERMVENALVSAAHLQRDPCYAFAKSPPSLPKIGGLLDEAIHEVARERKVELAKELEASAMAADPRVKLVRKASYSERVYSVKLMNSLGLDLAQEGSVTSLYVMAVAEEDGQGEVGHEYAVKRTLKELDPVKVGTDAGTRAASRLHGRIIKSGQMPVLLTGEAATGLINVLASSLCSDNVAKHRSFFIGKIGQRVAPRDFELVDDATLESGPGSVVFDGEGTASRSNMLIKSGVLKDFLYDLYWGKRAKLESNGSARRSLASPVRVGPSNLFLRPGSQGFNGLISDMGRGLVVDDLMGLHTANPVTGEFSLGATGRRVENGMPTYPVKGIALAGTIPSLLGSIEAIGSDLRFYGSTGSPSLLVSGLTVAGS